MPQEMECVYEVATGKPVFMHSVDAAEACTLGDYTRMRPQALYDDAPEMAAAHAAALAAARGMPGVKHPELMTPDERAESRRLANQAAMPVVSVPVGTPVVLAPGDVPLPPPPVMASTHRTQPVSPSPAMRTEEKKSEEKK